MLLPLLLLAPLLAVAEPAAAPRALTETENAEIGCIAAFMLIAYDQGRGAGGQEYPPLADRGKRYAGIVGDRITFASGQPKEATAVAIRAAIDREQAAAMAASDPATYVRGLMTPCLARLDAEVPAK